MSLSFSSWYSVANLSVRHLHTLFYETLSPKISGAGGKPQTCILRFLGATSVLPLLLLGPIVRLLVAFECIDRDVFS